MPFKNVADFKRQMQPGARVKITNHRQPHLSRVATVLTSSSTAFSVSLPDDHPTKKDYPDGSFMTWPKAALFNPEKGEISMMERFGSEIKPTLACTYEIINDGQANQNDQESGALAQADSQRA